MLDLWHEYEQATFGTKLLTWSGRRKEIADIRTLAGLRQERTDQEIADDELGDPVALVIPHGGVARGVVAPYTVARRGRTGRGRGCGGLVDRARYRVWQLPSPKVQASCLGEARGRCFACRGTGIPDVADVALPLRLRVMRCCDSCW